MARLSKEFYEFGPFRLIPDERLLLRCGEAISLTPKAFDLLLALVEQSGHLVEKDVLLKTVWPDSFVEENNLADNISRLRKALGERENGHKFIETVPKRGYRFVAGIRKNGAEAKRAADQPAMPISDAELLPASRIAPSAANFSINRVRISLFVLIVVVALSAAGVWSYSRVQERAELRQLQFKADFYATKWTEPEIRKGIEFYSRALALNPNSVEAFSGLAGAWLFLADSHVPPREAVPNAKAAVANALQRDEMYAPAHVSLGVIKMQYEWDWAGAEEEFKRAMRLDPRHHPAHQLYGWYLIAVGRLDEAAAEMKLALEADPVNDFSLWELGLCFYFARHFDEAVEQYRRAIAVDSRSHWPHMLLGWAFEQQGGFEEAISELSLASRLDDNPQVLASLAHAHAKAGHRAEAERLATELAGTAKRRYVSPYDVATVYAGLGDREKTLRWLEKAYDDRSGWLALWLKVDPKFDDVRSDPRFRDLLQRIGHV